MNYAFLAFWFFIALVLCIGGIINQVGRQDRELADESEPYKPAERFSYKTKREILSKMKGKI